MEKKGQTLVHHIREKAQINERAQSPLERLEAPHNLIDGAPSQISSIIYYFQGLKKKKEKLNTH